MTDKLHEAIVRAALERVQLEVEGYLPEFGAGAPQDGTDLIIDQCWRDFHKVILHLASDPAKVAAIIEKAREDRG
jgi:hypothetical protein